MKDLLHQEMSKMRLASKKKHQINVFLIISNDFNIIILKIKINLK
jgi:hypothetical protein